MVAADCKASGQPVPEPSQKTLTFGPICMVCFSAYSNLNIVLQSFNWEAFYQLLTNWIVINNQPFSEVDSPHLHAVLGFLKPFVAKKMVHRTEMTKKVLAAADEGRERLEVIISVSVPQWM